MHSKKTGQTDDYKRIDNFGKANRPSTPVKGIIFGQYGNAAADEINIKYEQAAIIKQNQKLQAANKNPTNTRARELAAQAQIQKSMEADYASQSKFKLKRFTNV